MSSLARVCISGSSLKSYFCNLSLLGIQLLFVLSGCQLQRGVLKARVHCISKSRFIKHAGFYCKLNKVRRLNKTINYCYNEIIPSTYFLAQELAHSAIAVITLSTQALSPTSIYLFMCLAWPHSRPLSTQVDYSNGPFICYAWPLQRPTATQADYSITALLFVMHGHKGPQPHRLITA